MSHVTAFGLVLFWGILLALVILFALSIRVTTPPAEHTCPTYADCTPEDPSSGLYQDG